MDGQSNKRAAGDPPDTTRDSKRGTISDTTPEGLAMKPQHEGHDLPQHTVGSPELDEEFGDVPMKQDNNESAAPPRESMESQELNDESGAVATQKDNSKSPAPAQQSPESQEINGESELAPTEQGNKSTAPPQPVDTAEAVYQYLETQKPKLSELGLGSVSDVQPIQGGSTNVVFRISFCDATDTGQDPSLAHEPPTTATRSVILKYYPDYPRVEPQTSQSHGWPSPPRQLFEFVALDDLRSRLVENGVTTHVELPVILLYDQPRGVTIMGDIGSHASGKADNSRIVASLADLCRLDMFQSDELPLVREIGSRLGEFLFNLHEFGGTHGALMPHLSHLAPYEHVTLQWLFRGNEEAKKLDFMTTIGWASDHLCDYGIELSPEESKTLDKITTNMCAGIMAGTSDTIRMGDLSHGNVMVTFERHTPLASKLVAVHLIDWEYATGGINVIDLAHFAAEAWLRNRFHSAGSTGAEANIAATVALCESYKRRAGYIDPRYRRLLFLYIGASIISSVSNGKWTQDAQIRDQVAREGLNLLFRAHVEDWDAVKKDSFLALLDL